MYKELLLTLIEIINTSKNDILKAQVHEEIYRFWIKNDENTWRIRKRKLLLHTYFFGIQHNLNDLDKDVNYLQDIFDYMDDDKWKNNGGEV